MLPIKTYSEKGTAIQIVTSSYVQKYSNNKIVTASVAVIVCGGTLEELWNPLIRYCKSTIVVKQ